MGLNRQTILGNLGKDPELRQTNNGTSVCNIRIGASMREKVDGEWTGVTEWFDCVLWGNQADIAGKHLSKGDQVYLEGRTKTRNYEKDGQTVYKTEVVIDLMEFANGSRSKNNNASSYGDEHYNRADKPTERIPF